MADETRMALAELLRKAEAAPPSITKIPKLISL